MLSSAVMAETPVECILEHTQPGWHHAARRLPGRRCPRPLPHHDTALWVRHHGQVPTVSWTQSSNAGRTAVRIEWILSRRQASIISILHWHQTLRQHWCQHVLILEYHLSCQQFTHSVQNINGFSGACQQHIFWTNGTHIHALSLNSEIYITSINEQHNIHISLVLLLLRLQCSDSVGWMTWRVSSL